jgi:RNA polymerase sigma-70 factor (ECF subfamily)
VVDRELIVRARSGDRDAFATIVTASIGRLDAVARLIIRDPDRAKDAVQDTLTRAWRYLPGLRDVDRFEAWLHRLLVRACADELRRRRAHVELTSSIVRDVAVGDSAAELADRDALERGFRRLPVEQRAVLVLHFYLGMTLLEVAETLRMPPGTARSRLHRGMQALRAALETDARHDAEFVEGRVG